MPIFVIVGNGTFPKMIILLCITDFWIIGSSTSSSCKKFLLFSWPHYIKFVERSIFLFVVIIIIILQVNIFYPKCHRMWWKLRTLYCHWVCGFLIGSRSSETRMSRLAWRNDRWWSSKYLRRMWHYNMATYRRIIFRRQHDKQRVENKTQTSGNILWKLTHISKVKWVRIGRKWNWEF